MSTTIYFRFLDGADQAVGLPSYETSGAAGADLRANLPAENRAGGVVVPSGARALIPTGFAMEIPQGFEVQIRPRSGLALKQGITCLNTPGTIDSDYRGPVDVILINHSSADFVISHGDRIAQMVVAPVVQAKFKQVDELDETDRGAGGFGSTGSN